MSFWWVLLGGGLVGLGYQMGKDRGRLLQVGRVLLVAGVLVLGVVAAKEFWPKPSVTAAFSDVKLNIGKDERLTLSAKTTLPDGTKLNTWILQPEPGRRPLYSDAPLDPEKWEVVVTDGRFTSCFPSVYEKGIKAGRYILQFGILPNQTALLGPKNSWLSGFGVTTESSGHQQYTLEVYVEIPELSAHARN